MNTRRSEVPLELLGAAVSNSVFVISVPAILSRKEAPGAAGLEAELPLASSAVPTQHRTEAVSSGGRCRACRAGTAHISRSQGLNGGGGQVLQGWGA